MRDGRFIIGATLFLALLVPGALADDFRDVVSEGNEAFRNQRYDEALEKYQVAESEKPELPELDYNIANVLYHQGKYEEAVDKYTRAINTTDINLEARADFNLGNTYFRMGDYQNAILRYQEALEIDPTDMDAKYNLELARRMLKDQMQPSEQEGEKEEQEQQQQQDQQDQQEQQPEQQQQQEEQQKQNEQPQAPQDEKQMSREDAERILNALRDDEQDVQEKIRRETTGGDYVGKDW